MARRQFLLNSLVLVLFGLFAATQAIAGTMRYTGTVVTDIKMGGTLYRKAAVTITFVGDTADIAGVPSPAGPTDRCDGYFFSLAKGEATVSVESRGRTRTAHLLPNQLFVALDSCNGGIGFGSFVGPNGLEPAYPLAFTEGTADLVAIASYTCTAQNCTGTPEALTNPASMSGDAWSCIGYPPGLAPFGNGFCAVPDAPPGPYPLQSSDQGDIFVYQPYTRNQASDGTIQASYSGSLNRGTFSIAAVQTNSESVAATPPPVPANAAGMPFVYTLRTVADGKLGTHVFSEALVTIRMWANSGTFSRKASSNGGFLYTNTGPATVSVIDGAWTRTATFSSNEIYVFYDTGIGVAGFGSRISPTYPIALDCVNTAYPSVGNYNTDCTTGDWWTNGDYYDGTLGALVDPIAAALGTGNDVANVGDYFPFLTPGDPGYNPLPQSLTRSTLLTGRAHTCAGVYTSDPSSGYLGVCSGPAPRGLRTNLGGFFLQDQSGVESLGYDANVGALQVEVMSRD